jgi:hypothetical protein
MTQNIPKNIDRTFSEAAVSTSVPAKKSVLRKAGSHSPSKTATLKSIGGENIDAQPSKEQVALRAYFIGERRRNMGFPGDETSDWVEAEREISEESKTSRRLLGNASGRRLDRHH